MSFSRPVEKTFILYFQKSLIPLTVVTIVHPAVKNVPEDMAQLGALATANGTPTETHAQVKTMMISFSNYSFRIYNLFFL